MGFIKDKENKTRKFINRRGNTPHIQKVKRYINGCTT